MIALTKKRSKKSPTDLAITVFSYLVLAAIVVLTIYPLLWMVFGALKSESEFYQNIWGVPAVPLWQNFATAWQMADMGTKFLNSFLITAGTLILILPLTSMTAYAFAKMKFPGSTILFYFFIFSLMIPQGITAIPVFSTIINLGLLGTRISVILVYVAQGLGFGIFLMRAFFLSLPKELEEAAQIDGCTPIGAFFRIIMPLALPGLATQLIFSGMNAWNEYFMASILIRSEAMQTLPLGVVSFVGQRLTNYPLLFADLAIITAPMILLYVLGQKYFISGLTAGALKG